MGEYYTVKEAADKIGVHSQTIRNWYRSGILTPYRPNPTGKVYIKKKELDNVMERVNGQEAKPQ